MSPKAQALLERAKTASAPIRRRRSDYEDMLPAAEELARSQGYGPSACARWLIDAGEAKPEEFEAVRCAVSRRFRREGI